MAIKPIPVLVFGMTKVATTDVGALLRYGDSATDNGLPILFSARTAEIALAGMAGKVSFDRIFVGVTFTHPFKIQLRPITDGKTIVTEYAFIQVTAADFANPVMELTERERATHLFEVTLSEPYIRGEDELSRHALMGTYFQVEVEQVDPLAEIGDLIIESIELEYEVLVESQVT